MTQSGRPSSAAAILVLCCLLAPVRAGAQGLTAGTQPSQTQTNASVQAEGDSLEVEAALRTALAEIEKAKLAVVSESRESLGNVQREADRLSLLINVLTTVLTILTVIGVVTAGAVGYGVIPTLNKAVQKANELNQHTFFLQNLEDNFKQALADIETRLKSGPVTILVGEARGKAPRIAEDDDAIVVLGYKMQLGSKEPVKFARSLVVVGRYWRRYSEWDRAKERLYAAIALDPRNAEAYQNLARALWNSVGEERVNSGRMGQPLTIEEKRTLGRALEYLNDSEERCGHNPDMKAELLFDRGAIAHTSGEWDEAVKLHVDAMKASERAAQLAGGREPDWTAAYSCACSLARAGKLQEAFDQLANVVQKDRTWDVDRQIEVAVDFREMAGRDPDFEALRLDVTWAAKFDGLVKP